MIKEDIVYTSHTSPYLKDITASKTTLRTSVWTNRSIILKTQTISSPLNLRAGFQEQKHLSSNYNLTKADRWNVIYFMLESVNNVCKDTQKILKILPFGFSACSWSVLVRFIFYAILSFIPIKQSTQNRGQTILWKWAHWAYYLWGKYNRSNGVQFSPTPF